MSQSLRYKTGSAVPFDLMTDNTNLATDQKSLGKQRASLNDNALRGH